MQFAGGRRRLDDETEFGSVKQILTDETQFEEADEA